MMDHDEGDCLQWLHNKETLRQEEKQYGPWLRATQDCLQRPQLVIASNRSIANPKRKGEGDEEVGPTSCGSKKRMAA